MKRRERCVERKGKGDGNKKCNGVNWWNNDIDFHESQRMMTVIMIIILMMMKMIDGPCFLRVRYKETDEGKRGRAMAKIWG